MNMSNPPIHAPVKEKEDTVLDLTLRPQKWDEYIGQEHVKKNLNILLRAAKGRNEPVEHILLSGPAGLGKTTMAHLIGREMNTNVRVTSGPAIERVGDLASILTNLLAGDILFIDEIHRLNKLVEEVLYPAMEARTLDIIIGKGPSARTLQIELPPFTLIAATTRPGLLSSPLRSRFGMTFRLDFYALDDIQKIIMRSARILGVGMDEDAYAILARSSRFTPRVANRLLKRMRDYAQVHGNGKITKDVAASTLALLEIDEKGLEQMDRRILEIIVQKFGGGPVGLQTLAAASFEEGDSIEEVYEPYLMQLGFLERTSRGRVATPQAYRHLGIKIPSQAPLLS
ncbi:MAG: holliday junction DNA helicase RuvB [Parcubacteria group bacterium Gr01-1014_33]|nr:MAG: holliday junction DNA helicase RuvB [Parcubacteria group bacterium Gr01-1014_33]